MLLLANAISGLAQGISMLAIPWYFSEIIGKPELFGWLYALTTFIMLFWGLYAGSLIDKHSRKRVFLGINLFGATLLSTVSLFGFITGDVGAVGAILVFSGTILIYNIHYPALYAFGQEITERKFYSRFTSTTEIVGQSTSIISGALGAILLSGFDGNTYFPVIKPWTLHEIFLADAITYWIGIVLIAAIRYHPIAVRHTESGSVIKRIRIGVDFLKEHKLIFLFGNASYAIFIVLLVTVQQLLPVYTSNYLNAGPGIYAFAEMAYAVGAMLAGIGIIRLFRKKGLVAGVVAMMLITIVTYLIAGFSKSVELYLFLSVVLGITNAGARVLRTTWLFEHVPNQSIGRVSSVFQSINILHRVALSAVCSLPFFHAGTNIRFAYVLCAAIVLVYAIPLVLNYRQLAAMKEETGQG
jgi:DHA3 family macrolide efflux protein-like MFS transporter